VNFSIMVYDFCFVLATRKAHFVLIKINYVMKVSTGGRMKHNSVWFTVQDYVVYLISNLFFWEQDSWITYAEWNWDYKPSITYTEFSLWVDFKFWIIITSNLYSIWFFSERMFNIIEIFRALLSFKKFQCMTSQIFLKLFLWKLLKNELFGYILRRLASQTL
jgi:hypothetical protein